jgi:ABC-type cobalamin/Fe3+-siderophores transport system ATPase subunit
MHVHQPTCLCACLQSMQPKMRVPCLPNLPPSQDVWGCARPGELHGLLGPSGAGKSTLLDLLTGRLKRHHVEFADLGAAQITSREQEGNSTELCYDACCNVIELNTGGEPSISGGCETRAPEKDENSCMRTQQHCPAHTVGTAASTGSSMSTMMGGHGRLLLNGVPATARTLAQASVYVPQHDCLVPVLSARESLEFAAALRIPGSADECTTTTTGSNSATATRTMRVQELLELLGLTAQQDVLVGSTPVLLCIAPSHAASGNAAVLPRYLSRAASHPHMCALSPTRVPGGGCIAWWPAAAWTIWQ